MQRRLTEPLKAGGGGVIMMMMTLMATVTKLPVPVNDNFDEIECALLHWGLFKGCIKHVKQPVSR